MKNIILFFLIISYVHSAEDVINDIGCAPFLKVQYPDGWYNLAYMTTHLYYEEKIPSGSSAPTPLPNADGIDISNRYWLSKPVWWKILYNSYIDFDVYWQGKCLYFPPQDVDKIDPPVCPEGQEFDVETQQCKPPTCNPDTEIAVDGGCDCNGGHHKDESGVCVPDIDCPEPMVYKWVNIDYDFDFRGCIPNPNVTQSDCENMSDCIWITQDPLDPLSDWAMAYGAGAYSGEYLQDTSFDDALSNVVGALLPELGFTALAVSKALGTASDDIGNLFSKGANLWDDIKSAFKDSPENPDLQTYKPIIDDIFIDSDGIKYEVAPTPEEAALNSYHAEGYKNWLKENGYPETPIKSEPTDPIIVNDPSFPDIPSGVDDLFYKGGDSTEFNSNSLGTANMSKDGSTPNLQPLVDAPVGTQLDTTIPINSNLKGTIVKDYPATLFKDYENTLPDGTINSGYKGKVNFPDGSSTQLDISVSKLPDGTEVITTKPSYEVPTEDGKVKIFDVPYTVTKDGSGTTTNVINKPSTITQVNPDGSIGTNTNNPSTSSVPINNSNPSISLEPVVKKLDDIQKQLKDMWEHQPSNSKEFETAMKTLKTALLNYQISIDTAKDFFNNIKDTLDQLENNFNNARDIFMDKPDVNVPSGVCPFTISGKAVQGGKTHTLEVNPCKYVAPYKPILSVIFTFWMSWGVILFAIKYLFSPSLGGKK